MNAQKEKLDKTAASNQWKDCLGIPATVNEVIAGANPGDPEQARISLDGATEPYNEIRVENPLHNSCGDAVTLAKGDHVRLNVANCDEEPSGEGTDRRDPTKS